MTINFPRAYVQRDPEENPPLTAEEQLLVARLSDADLQDAE